MGNHNGDKYAYDFGLDQPAAGFRKVGPEELYTEEKGYGFTNVERVYAKRRGPAGDPRFDFCIPFYTSFRLDLEKGRYTVTILLGDERAATETTIKAGEGKLMIHKQQTMPGQYSRVGFTVVVDGGYLILAFSGRAPRINAMEVAPAPQASTIFLVGDSTVTDQPADGYPYAGWGQMLPRYIKADAAVDNHAMSGRSSKSFIGEGRLEEIWRRIQPHDYLIIQFGHNDQKSDEERRTEPYTTYKEYLLQYINGAREREAIPILVTPVHRRFFEEDGTLRDTHGDYLTAVRELAQEYEVPLVDLAEKTRKLYEQLGPEASKELFMWLVPGEYINFPDGVEDNTHFQEVGAIRIAELVIEGLKELKLMPLNLFIR